MSDRICLIGFGEVGQVLAADLRASGRYTLAAWDLKFADPASAPSRALEHGGAAASIAPAAVFLDLNSVSPATKARAAAPIGAGGGHYVEAAIMAPIAPARIASPMLLAARMRPRSCERPTSSGFVARACSASGSARHRPRRCAAA